MTDSHLPATRFSVHVGHESDVVVVRQRARELAREQGLPAARAEALAIAATEIACNIVAHARHGVVLLGTVVDESRRGVVVIARDAGPGIAQIEQAMADGFSTGNGLGFGLPGARRLVDEFEIESHVGTGTTVTLRQWVQPIAVPRTDGPACENDSVARALSPGPSPP
jgi:serine/threonine-protein kinase RsbT